jgi:phenylalanyl-tRNA synthetase beta chain
MNVSYRWLRSLAPDLDGAPEALAERLAALGFPGGGSSLAEGLDGIVVARVDSVRPHPNADRLRVCEVDGGRGSSRWSAARTTWRRGVVSLRAGGRHAPGGMKIRKAKLRGEVSEGMLCSESELGLGRERTGSWSSAPGPAPPGAPLVEALGLDDVRLEVEVTSNRPDLLSHRGSPVSSLRRDGDPRAPRLSGSLPGVAAAAGGADLVAHPLAEGDPASVRIEAPTAAPLPGARGARRPGGSLAAWLQSPAPGGGRPTHQQRGRRDELRAPRDWDSPSTPSTWTGWADGPSSCVGPGRGDGSGPWTEWTAPLDPEMLAICDAERPMAVAGVMGGEESEVTDTTDLLLECALFTPGPIRATRKALGLSTDASYRFERGVDPDGLWPRSFAAPADPRHRGRDPRRPDPGRGPGPSLAGVLPSSGNRVERVLGVPFDRPARGALLAPLGFEVNGRRDGGIGDPGLLGHEVRVPWRSWDVTREIDLIEEVARRHGYDRFPDTCAPYPSGSGPGSSPLRAGGRDPQPDGARGSWRRRRRPSHRRGR